MDRFSVAGRSADTAATADHVAGALWNPSSNVPLFIAEAHIFLVGATISNVGLIRTSTRGTPGSTVTPDLDNNYSRQAAPLSGALLDLAAYSAQPTVQGPYMKRGSMAAAQGAGFIWVFGKDGIKVPPGTGIALATPVAVILQDSDITWVWDE
jgi:hypothetical protein